MSVRNRHSWDFGFQSLLYLVLPAILVLILNGQHVYSKSLTPPYINLAEGKKITASATCGVDTEGPELYCKLIGANAENEHFVNVIQGQFCDYCDPSRPDKAHPPEHAVDGLETWWQSPPLSRGMKYNEVNLTIDLGQEFHVAYVYIKMGNSPRPGLWVLEKSADYGKTYKPWQYFSDSKADCELYFGKETLQTITKDDSVICNTEYSKIVPLEGGEIPISLLNNRPSADHYFNSTILQDWTRATNIRLRLLRTKNLLGHLMFVARQDPTVTRRYFYSIKDISIGGRCMCNGHADTCDRQDPLSTALICRCQHNTCGAKCDQCCRGYEQKAWKISKANEPFLCEPCNCFNHSDECMYDPEVDMKRLSLDIRGRYEGGGVCQNCRHNTEGINCNKCKSKYFRPYEKQLNETDACQLCNCDHFYSTGNCADGSGRCQCKEEFKPPNCDSCSYGYFGYPDCKPCECFLNGTRGEQCESRNGECPCLSNFGGRYCKECAPGYFNFSTCEQCQCIAEGSVSEECDQISGNCTCKSNFGGKHCEQCQDGYYQYPACQYCNCDREGTLDGVCDKNTGQCLCKEGYGGERCDQCVPGYYDYPQCKPCNCSIIGSVGKTCGNDGKCQCSSSFAGKTCNQCSPGFYKYPECLPCNCDSYGSNGISCDGEGKCNCQHNFDGLHCEKCKESFYNFPACEDCNCHPAGVVASFAGCGSVPAGELCKCKDRVEGRICDRCKPLFWNLSPLNPQGCEECRCNIAGVLGGIGVCEVDSGQCICKTSVVARGCTECADGTYNLQESNLLGCTDCGCDIGGSVNPVCNKQTGQCLCQSRVIGRTCKEPLQAHYFPTLYQYQYEVENGRTLQNTIVRYGYDENIFPNISWKGYAIFSQLQRETLQEIYIQKSSLYRMIIKFLNKNPDTVIGTIKIVPDNPNDNEQVLKVQFRNTGTPEYVTVSGATGNTPSPFVMNPGRWTVHLQIPKDMLIDYFVLLPEDFYLASILNQKVEKPCIVNDMSICRDYTYPNLTLFKTTWGVEGYRSSGGSDLNDMDDPRLHEYFKDSDHLSSINVVNKIPMLNPIQPVLNYNLEVEKAGRYVIVVNYVTPLNDNRTNTIDVKIRKYNPDGTNYEIYLGTLNLYSCPYTMQCRQAVINLASGVGVYDVGKTIPIMLKGENANVGIHSIVAIPYEQWSLDYIKPKPVCIRKDGHCIQSSFRNPPETKKIQFEQDYTGVEGNNATNIINKNSASYIWLNPSDKSIDIKGKVPTPGYYTFILHYYQPDFPEFNLDVIIQNGQFYEAKVPIENCPSKSGCRSVVKESNRDNKFNLMENFMITFSLPEDKNVYLDYILVVPADLYSTRHLEEENLDRTGDFISTCGANHFNVDTTQEGFCRDSVFSITAAHNGGALQCRCDYAGSVSFHCDKFGGQCQCKPNIIGRECEACKTGYYGFPDCRPCNCPSTAFCKADTGECICPLHVIGEQCDKCMVNTYGYDPIIGCEECKCNVLGVHGTQQCDLLTGNCPCKENIVGRQCDKCLAGYYAFPHCQSCECDTRGTTEEICDQHTAECQCKKNTVGFNCDICREGSFNLQANNEEGCSECFCFGKTTRCVSSKLVRTVVYDDMGWGAIGVNISTGTLEIENLTLAVEHPEKESVGIDFKSAHITNKVIYFVAPQAYLGSKLTSYGGFFNYTIFYTIGSQGTAVSGPDIILVGNNTYLSYSSFEQPPHSETFPASVQLVESNFELPNSETAKREHLMEVLQNLKGIYVRASYWTVGVTTKISIMLLEDAIAPVPGYPISRGDQLASSVEQCQCPPNYQGLSCEECAPGFYRIRSGPHGGYCVPCQCNGHAEECDVNTGICFNCTYNTVGDHCEKCAVGYHGNALAGTPNDCLICACPLPTPSNNFATACDLSSDGERISCECIDGYIGGRCQACGPGFYGSPEIQGDYCKPCQCSGNINPGEQGSCDTVTGECLRCLNNSFGQACALCAPGFYGDAVERKDCQSCTCDMLGTDHCDSYTGRCVCKPNVIGEKCDRCVDNHYGFQSGNGCNPCDCAEASDSDQCDDVTGQCRCKPGVTGRTCDRCTGGYWNYTINGCVSCGCKSEYSLGFGCNALTGQCECLKGVIGEKCNQCPHRWAFVQEYGCHECDTCTHALLDDTDELGHLLEPTILYFDSTQSGYFTKRKLENLKEQLETLKPRFDNIDPQQIELTSFFENLDKLEQSSKNLNRKTNYSLENSDKIKKDSEKLKDQADLLYEDLLDAEEGAMKVLNEIEFITNELNNEEGAEVEQALAQAEAMVKEIDEYNNIDEYDGGVDEQLEKVQQLLEEVQNFKLPVVDVDKQVMEVKADLRNFSGKLDDLSNHTQYSLNKAKDVEKILERSGKDRLKKKLENIATYTSESKQNLDDSENLNSNSTKYLEEARAKIRRLRDVPTKLEGVVNDFNASIIHNDVGINEIYVQLPIVRKHADDLSSRAQELDSLLTETRIIADIPIRAVNAYKDIVEAVKNAKESAVKAENNSNNAIEMLTGVENKTFNADQTSTKSLDDAHELFTSTADKLEPKLERAKENYKPVKHTYDDNVQRFNEFLLLRGHIQNQSLDDAYKKAIENANTASSDAESVKGREENNFGQLKNETKQAVSLSKDVDDALRSIMQTDKQLQTVNEKLPPIVKSLKELPEQQERQRRIAEDIEIGIQKLKEQINFARDIANRVKVGVKFFPNTTLELRNPPNLQDLSTSTQISGYFRTPKENGLVWYLGNPQGTNLRRTKTDDYMALAIQNGYPVLKLDIGNGPEQVSVQKYVADNTWYQFVIDRTGHNAKLTIKEEGQDGKMQPYTAEETLNGTYSMFNLDQDKSKLFVGSLPTYSEIQPEIDANAFEGEIEDIVIGDRPVSLWNFVNGYENHHGAIERNKMVNLEPSTGYRFNGNGYAILDARSYSLRSRSDIQLNFKTFASEGLIFLAGKGNKFVALEMRNGKVLYQYNLGSNTKLFVTSKTYNDGEWHTISASRDGALGGLVVDGERVIDKFLPIQGNTLDPVDTISFGGYPGNHKFQEVTNTKFDGCIDHISITSTPVDLRNHIHVFDVQPGCPDKYSKLVSFNQQRPGYIASGSLGINNNFKISLKFKTKEKDGLLFFATNRELDSGISLALNNGHLILISEQIQLVSKDTFNDSEWHVVAVMHNDKELRIDFDDFSNKVTDSAPPPLYIMHGIIYIGGLPRRKSAAVGTVGSSKPFHGCIGDVTLNGDVVNFANLTDKSNEILGKCILDELLTDTGGDYAVPELQPITFEPILTLPPETATDDSIYGKGPNRGDGGSDFARLPTNETEVETTLPSNVYEPEVVTPPDTAKPWIAPTTQEIPQEESCALPLDPLPENFDIGSYRFGTKANSRLEFSHARGRTKKAFVVSLEFRTENPNGILFYVSNDEYHNQNVALYLQGGNVNLLFKTGGQPTILKSKMTFNDNKWHLVEFSRNGLDCKLVIDGRLEADGGTAKMELKPPIYVGGIGPRSDSIVTSQLNITNAYSGCIRNVNMNDKPLESPVNYGAIQCSENVESGTFFGSGVGYIKLMNKVYIGETFKISFSIKPRTNSALLIAAHGKEDHFILEMIDGNIKLTVENGRGPISAVFKPESKFYLCDGKWHSIQAIKSKNVITLAVDNVFQDPQVGDIHSPRTDTVSPLFFGGHRIIHKVRALSTRKSFVGCVKDVIINDSNIILKPLMASGNITIGTCRTN